MEFLVREPELYQQVQLLLKFASGGHIAGGGGLEAYLAYMAARLFACRLVLKETGSLYLHCDPTAGHYLKLLLDAIFGTKNFRNELVWRRYGSHNDAKRRFGRVHDNIFFYSASDAYNWISTYEAYDEEYVRNAYRNEDTRGRYTTSPLHARTLTGGGYEYEWRGIIDIWKFPQSRLEELDKQGLIHWPKRGSSPRRKVYLDEAKGLPARDLILDVKPLATSSKERIGWPTQKPLALLERIIRASSSPGDLVLDPFCGCGTAVEAAQNLGRRWIGIDVEPLAVDLMARRLRERCSVNPRISGIPYDFDQARRLAENAPYEFERWALRLVPGAQPNFKQSGDGGLDGRAVVNVDTRPHPLYGFQVKGGQNVGRPVADAFSGALTQHGCAAGLLIVLNERNARRIRHAIGAQERVQLNGWQGPRISVWSVEDWFASGHQCTLPRPSLMGEAETLELLRPQDWQRRLGI